MGEIDNEVLRSGGRLCRTLAWTALAGGLALRRAVTIVGRIARCEITWGCVSRQRADNLTLNNTSSRENQTRELLRNIPHCWENVRDAPAYAAESGAKQEP